MERKVKICFIIKYLGHGGAEKALFYLVKLMDKHRFDITVFTVFAGGEMEENFRKLDIKLRHPYSRVVGKGGFFKTALNHIQIKWIEGLIKRNSRELLKIATGEEYDIVVSYHVDNDCYGIGITKFGKRIKYIHADLKNDNNYLNDNRYMNRMNDCYDKIICVSSVAKAAYDKQFGGQEKSTSCINPIDSENVISLSKKGHSVSAASPYYCAVGRITKSKGFERLLLIHKMLRENACKLNLVIVGDGPDYDNLMKMVKKYKINDSVILAGYQSNPYTIMKESKFLVVPSYAEGLSMVAMEAIILGIPVVSCCSSVDDIIGNTGCGIITDNTNEALYEGILRMSDEAFYETAKNAAQKRRDYFDRMRMVKRVEAIYSDLKKS